MSDSIQLEGTILKIFPENVISEKFKKREFVLEHAPNPTYPETLKIEVVQDKCDLLDKYKVDDRVVVDLNLKGREWSKGKDGGYINSLQAWRITYAEAKKDDQPW